MAEDLYHRLAEHHAGKAKHTSKDAPWWIEAYVAVLNHQKAIAFER